MRDSIDSIVSVFREKSRVFTQNIFKDKTLINGRSSSEMVKRCFLDVRQHSTGAACQISCPKIIRNLGASYEGRLGKTVKTMEI